MHPHGSPRLLTFWKLEMKSWALASLAAAITSSSVAPSLPLRMLSPMLPANSTGSCCRQGRAEATSGQTDGNGIPGKIQGLTTNRVHRVCSSEGWINPIGIWVSLAAG
jgi:hypothetical protein